MRNRKQQAGFTLLEVMVVIGIVGIMAAIAVPMFARSQNRSDHRAATSSMVSDIRRARSYVKTGYAQVAAWPPNTRTVQAGIQINTNTSYSIIVDSDNTQGNAPTDAVVEVIDLPTRYQGSNFQITAPAVGTEIRFKKNGTLTQSADINIVLTDANGGATRTITVTYGGNASFQ